VDEYAESPLEGLKLRGRIAFASRCARRVFPTVVLVDDAVQECDKAIAMAEAFAAGEPGALLRARQVADAVRDAMSPAGGGDLGGPQQNGWSAARHAAAELAEAAVSAFSAVTRTPPSKSCCQEAAEHADIAVKYAQGTMERLQELVTPDRPTYAGSGRELFGRFREGEWVRQAWKDDLETLHQSHRGLVTELGRAVDTSPRGSLGPLWLPDRVPGWYQEGLRKWRKPRGITVITADQFLRSDGHLEPFPDLVCWHLDSEATVAELDELKESLRAVDEVCRILDRSPPGLVVYAPGIAEEQRLQLVVDFGAMAWADPPVRRPPPRDAQSLCDLVRDRLEATYEGWKQDDRGLWLYAGARVTWRGGAGPRPVPAGAEEPGTESVEPTEDEASQEDYRNLLKYLKADPWWQAEY
jgi:hypothetical protein